MNKKVLQNTIMPNQKVVYSLFCTILTLCLFSCKSQYIASNDSTVVCTENMYKTFKYDNEIYDDVIVEKCFYKDHVFKSIGFPDYSRRYSHEYFIYKIKNIDTIQVSNTDFFNANYKQLEKLINTKLKASFDEDAKHEELKDCIKRIKFRYYNLNEFGISFRDNNLVQFNISHGISMMCAPVAIGIVELKRDELSKYLN